MRSGIRNAVAVGLAVLGTASVAHAGGKRFTSPLLSTGTNEVFVCAVVNVDKKPVTADVKIVSRQGTQIMPAATDCDQPIAPNAGCRVAGPTGTTTAYCDAVTSSAKVRVDLLVIDGVNPNHTIAAVPATLK